MLVSDCCGAPSYGYEDYGICSDCKDHCEYVDENWDPIEEEDPIIDDDEDIVK